MTRRILRQIPLWVLVILVVGYVGAEGQQARPDEPGAAKAAPQAELAPRGQRMAKAIKYSDWEKLCFRVPGANMLCRTSSNGNWETGQTAVRVDLIEREGDPVVRLQILLPAGLYLQAGVKLTVDNGPAFPVPYTWCFTNTCVAASVVEPNLVKQLESGEKLTLEVVDTNVLTATTSLSLAQFAAVHRSPPSEVFDQALDSK